MSNGEPRLTPSELRELLEYDPQTGVLSWREPSCSWFKSPGHWRAYKDWVAGRGPFTSEHSAGYLVGNVLSRQMLAHRVAWAVFYGVWPEQIDHINHDKKDNRLTNLRDAPQRENAKNASMREDNTSGVVGVTWSRTRRKWAAQIVVDYKTIPLGRYTTFAEAVRARKEAEQKYGFHENHGKGGRAV